MGDMGDFWNDVKDHYRKKQAKYQDRVSWAINGLMGHPECKEVGDHWRIGGKYDFWHTGTVVNIKNREEFILIEDLAKKFGIKKK